MDRADATLTAVFAGPVRLSAPEARVLGCLLEKQHTTPDAYPLSLNGLRLACNQSTNRDPVLEYDEAMIRDALHRLERRGLTRLASGAGSRAAKYRHLLAEALPMDDGEQAIMCVLMLRGAQTPGELKQRTERMHAFAALASVHETLERLIGRGLATRLERRPGQKEERYEQLLSDSEQAAEDGRSGDDLTAPAPRRPTQPGVPAPAGADVELLGERVARLERELAALRAAFARAGGAGAGEDDRGNGAARPA